MKVDMQGHGDLVGSTWISWFSLNTGSRCLNGKAKWKETVADLTFLYALTSNFQNNFDHLEL